MNRKKLEAAFEVLDLAHKTILNCDVTSEELEAATNVIREYCLPAGEKPADCEFLADFKHTKRGNEDRRLLHLHLHERIGSPYNPPGVRTLRADGEFNIPSLGSMKVDNIISAGTLERVENEALSALEAKLKGGI